MRALRLLLALGAASALTIARPASAQVTESERSAARQLFREGDQLQRAGKFVEALDRFERAQQVFSAPTNMLRIAECDAALGHLVQSAEAYRALVRTPLPAGSPAAFQSAVDQARAELAQVEPRVPKLVVQLEPANAPAPQLQIDGQPVHAALLGEPFPLDPGTHKVSVAASGFVTAEQSVVLKERETKTLPMTLTAIAGVTYAPGVAPGSAGSASGTEGPGSTQLPPGTPPPPPLVEGGSPEAARKRSRGGLLLGLHLGAEIPAGQIPTPAGDTIATSAASGAGLAYGLDLGIRFARHWIIGLTVEHASLGAGTNPSRIEQTATGMTTSNTSAGVVLGYVVNPDRVSFFGEVGLQGRWYKLSWNDPSSQSASYSTGELLLGMGIWIPAGRVLRLLPEATIALGDFSTPSTGGTASGTSNSASPGHAFVMLGLAGMFNIGF
jgi:hypothetical protein